MEAHVGTTCTASPETIALSFKQLGVSSLFPPRPILSNVSGFVVKGGITASKRHVSNDHEKDFLKQFFSFASNGRLCLW